jgi:hypothetical protein
LISVAQRDGVVIVDRGPGPAAAPHRTLALDARHLARALRERSRDAGLWGEPAFARDVDRIRRQLGPIRSRHGLAASFEREAVRDRSLRVAYAVRWLELGDGVPRPGWTRLVTARA